MNKIIAGLIVIVLVVAATPTFAQDDDADCKNRIKAGWFFWSDDELKDEDFDSTWIIGVDRTRWLENGLGMGLGVQFLKKTVEYEGSDLEASVRAIPINADLFYKVSMEDNNAFYLGAGPSLVFLDVSLSVGNVSFSVDDRVLGFNAVAGFEMDQFFFEGQYLWAKAEFEIDVEDVDVETDKIQYGGFSVMAGYRF